MSLFTRKSVADEIKELLSRAENLYINNIDRNFEAIDSKLTFSYCIVQLKNLVEKNIKKET